MPQNGVSIKDRINSNMFAAIPDNKKEIAVYDSKKHTMVTLTADAEKVDEFVSTRDKSNKKWEKLVFVGMIIGGGIADIIAWRKASVENMEIYEKRIISSLAAITGMIIGSLPFIEMKKIKSDNITQKFINENQ